MLEPNSIKAHKNSVCDLESESETELALFAKCVVVVF